MSKLTKFTFNLIDLLVIMMMTFGSPMSALAAVWTDQPDYTPGSIVTIYGDNSNEAGYLPGETVQVEVTGPNGYASTCQGVADETGAWSCQVTLWDSLLAVGDYTYIATGLTSLVSESGTFTDASGDFSIDFVAAAPYSYNHLTGGGAYDDRTIGTTTGDVVESLEGADFACGDIVTYLAAVTVDDVATADTDAPQTIEMDFSFLMDTTGQSGVAIGDIVLVQVNYAPIEDLIAGEDDVDQGIVDDGGSVATLTNEWTTGPMFVAGSELWGTVELTDLERAEQVVVRIDVKLFCNPGQNPTGNLAGNLQAARLTYINGDTAVVPPQAIPGGAQTIPFQKFGGLNIPQLTIQKTVTTADGTCPGQESLNVSAGDTVKYCYVVSDPGDAPLYNVALVDDNGTPGDTGDDFPVTLTSGLTDVDGDGFADDLATGATATGEALVTLTLSTAGTVVNIGTASGDDSIIYPTTLTASDDASVVIPAAPSLVVTKTADPTVISAPGPINYTVTVYNDGNVTLVPSMSDLLNSGLNTDLVLTLTLDASTDVGSDGVLSPGETWTYTTSYTVTQADIDDGSNLYNVACAEDVDGDGEDECDDATTTITQNPALTIDKTVTAVDADDEAPFVVGAAGDVIYYSILVTNVGNQTLTGVTVDDPLLGALTCTPAQPATLAPAASMTCTGSYEVTQADIDNNGGGDGDIDNTATADSDQTGPSSDSEFVPLTQNPVIQVEKSSTTTLIDHAGQVVTYTFVVTNIGNVTLSGITVTDPNCDGAPAYVSGDLPEGFGDGLLQLTETWTYTCDHTVTQAEIDSDGGGDGDLDNTVTADSNESDEDTDDHFIPISQNPAIDIYKITVDGATEGDGLTILIGEAISWKYTVTNIGNVTLYNIVVSDDNGTADPTDDFTATCLLTSLFVGESTTCTATGTAAAGLYENAGTVTADDPQGDDATDSDTSSYFGADPQINIVKVTQDKDSNWGDNVIVIAGTTVTWRYTVTNVGNVPLSNVTVTDSVSGVTPTYVSGDTNGDSILDLTETWIYETSGTAIGGDYSNIGKATGTYTDDADHSRAAEATDPSSYVGKVPVKVEKTVNQQPFSGPELTFELREGAAPVSGQFGTVLETAYANSTNGGIVQFYTLFVPGTYQLCEYVPEGYVPSYIWGVYGVDWFKPGYAPNEGSMLPYVLICSNFVVNPDGTINFQNGHEIVPVGGAIHIDNQVGQMPRTIGYWKNHASAKESNGGQDPILDQMLYKADQLGTPITIGTLVLYGGSTPDDAGIYSTYAIRLLNKSTIDTNKKKASDPCFNLAAQLLAYRLNQALGAWPNDYAQLAAYYAQQMLMQLKFNGKSCSNPTKQAVANLNYLAWVLDAFNNDTLTLTPPLEVPNPGVYK